MGRAIMGAVDSADGFIAYDDDTVGPLFDWLGNGDVAWAWSEGQEPSLTAPFTFATSVESAISQAQDLAGPDRIVDVAAGQIGGQALRLGLIDQLVMHVVPVIFGTGRPYFGTTGPGETVVLANPSHVAQGDRVTHLLYDVEPPA